MKLKQIYNLYTFLFIFFIFGNFYIFAQESPIPSKEEEKIITLKFKDADINSVIDFISEATGITIIKSGDVSGRITVFNTQKLSKSEALSVFISALELAGMKPQLEGNVLKITADVSKSGKSVTIFFLSYMSSQELERVINQLFFGAQGEGEMGFPGMKSSAQGMSASIVSVIEPNALIAIGPPSDIAIIKDIVDKLDSKPSESQINIFVYHLKNAKAKELADVLTELLQPGITASKAGTATGMVPYSPSLSEEKEISAWVVADERTNSLIIKAQPQQINRLKEIIQELDIMPAQVFIEAVIGEVVYSDGIDIGTEWKWRQEEWGGTNATGSAGTDWDETKKARDLPGFQFSLVNRHIDVLVSTLQRRSKVKILSAPTLLTVDNKPAKIVVGSEVPYLTSSRQDELGNITHTFEYKDVGVKLEVTPHINPDKSVLLELHQEAKSVLDVVMFDAKAIAKRETQTSVFVKDGQTVVIGGIIKTDVSKQDRRIPILGSIPIVGYLFKREITTEEKTELFIFISPRIVTNEEELQKASDKEKERYKSMEGVDKK